MNDIKQAIEKIVVKETDNNKIIDFKLAIK